MIEIAKDHLLPRFKFLDVVPASPIPSQPLEIFWINQVEFINFINK